MRLQGRLTDWDDAKGFGFVTPNGGGERAFVHIKAFARNTRRPQSGDIVTYQPQPDGRGRVTATAVRFALARDGRRAPPRRATAGNGTGLKVRMVAGLALLIALATATVLALLPPWLGWAALGINAFTIGAYAVDKAAAQAGRWRTPENTLHLLGVLGGWPGALFAQGAFRHKSSKTAFQVVYTITVVANVVLVMALSKGVASNL